MVVTATQLKANLGHYLDTAASEDIVVMKNGAPVARLTSPYASRASRMEALFGILPPTASLEEARAIREEEKWGLC